MILKPINMNKKGSFGIAVIFAMIALIGALMVLSPDNKKPENVIDQEVSENSQFGKGNRPDYLKYMSRMIIVTSLMIIVIIYGAKWYKGKMQRNDSYTLSMKILGKQFLGSKHFLTMVRIDGKNFLLGVTDQSINLISEFPEIIEHEENKNSDSNPLSSSETFNGILKRMTGKTRETDA